MLVVLIAILYIGFMIYLANIEQVRGESHPLLTAMQYGLVLIIAVWVMNALMFIFVPPDQVVDVALAQQIERIDKRLAGFFVLASCLAMIAIVALIRSPIPHQWIEHYLYRKSDDTVITYDSTLSVHKLAIMLVIVQTTAIIWTFMASGGVGALDFEYSSPLNALGDLAIGAVLYSVCGILGVGWILRRDTHETLQRLGVRFPTRRDCLYGVMVAVVLYGVAWMASVLWAMSVSPEVLEQQTAASQQLFNTFNHSLLLGLVLALLTGISEELLFRGALQPVFGLIPTSIFFTIIHVQYTLTPATIILLVVSLGFGWLRQNVSTTSAMMAHILYNFIPFLLFALTTNSGVS